MRGEKWIILSEGVAALFLLLSSRGRSSSTFDLIRLSAVTVTQSQSASQSVNQILSLLPLRLLSH